MGLYKRGETYWGRYANADGKILRRSLGTSNKKLAGERLVKLKNNAIDERLGIARPAPDPISFEDFAELFLQKHSRHKASYVDDVQRARDYLIPALGQLKLSQIDAKRIAFLKTSLYGIERGRAGTRKEPSDGPVELSKATRNRILALLRSMLRKAKSWGYLLDVPEIKLFSEENRVRYLSEEEAKALLDQCEGELRAIVLLILNSALRPGEARRLTWDQVEKDSIVIKAKGGKWRRVPLNKNAREALQSLPHKSARVFPSMYQNLAREFRKAVTKAKLQTRGENRVTPHTLRHTALSRLAHRGADVTSLQRLAGHSSIVTTQRYIHSKDLAATVELLEA